MLHAHAATLAQARTCLAALADTAHTTDASVGYDQLLLHLDLLHDLEVPALAVMGSCQRAALFDLAESAIEELATHGLDTLTVELLLDQLWATRDLDVP